jgi:arylformamidase
VAIFDITPTVSPALAVWPGDTPPQREVLLEMKRGDNLTLSTFRSTVHIGAHVDAPSHYGADAASIERRPLELYLGSCHVVRVTVGRGRRIPADDVPVEPLAERMLFATGTYPDPTRFTEDFAALAPEAIDLLHERGVRLVGIDTPSIDLCDSKDLPSHQACLRHDMAILEGIVLEGVPEGLYELIALPLKLQDFDASPVRAVLRTVARG